MGKIILPSSPQRLGITKGLPEVAPKSRIRAEHGAHIPNYFLALDVITL